MGILDWLWSRLGWRTNVDLPVALPLNATTEDALGASLDRLAPSGRVYITESEAAHLFGSSNDSLHELKPSAMTEVGRFAARHGCSPRRVRSEGRVYFTKNPN